MKKNKITMIVVLAMLTAVEIVLSRLLSISLPTFKLSFSFLAVAFAAREYGPWGGAAVGAVGDLIGALLFPIGPYFPGFTLTAGLCGIVYGVCYRHYSPFITLVAEVINNFILGAGLNTLWLMVFFDNTLAALLPVRLLQAVISTAVGTVLLILMAKYVPHINAAKKQ